MNDHDPDIRLDLTSSWAEIVLKNHSGTNILSTKQLLSFREKLLALRAFEKIGAAIIASGNANGFAAGADMEELRKLDCTKSVVFSRLGQSIFSMMSEMPVLFIAAIDGYCIGGGFDLALACDIVVMTPRSFLQHPGTQRGFITGFGGNLRLSRVAGPRLGMQLLIMGNRIEPAEAAKIGLGGAQNKNDLRNARSGKQLLSDDAQTKARAIAARCSALSRRQLEVLKRTSRFSKALGHQDRIRLESRISLLSAIAQEMGS